VAGIDRQVMEGGACSRPVPEQLHIAKDAFKIGGNRIPDFQDFDVIILGLEKMRHQRGAVTGRSPMFRRGDDHLRLFDP
jgi:hypothetical protein